MCDEKTVKDANKFLAREGKLTRRQFGTLSAGAGLAMLLPSPANAQAVTETEVDIPTPDGTADCYFVHPSNGDAHPPRKNMAVNAEINMIFAYSARKKTANARPTV